MILLDTRFYVAGGALAPDAPSYVVRRADGDLYDGLSQGEFCYVLTSRQMGKSSLMVRAAARLQAVGVAVAHLDVTMVGRNLEAEQWDHGLLSHIGEQLDLWDELRRYWLDNQLLGPLQRWMAALRHVVLPNLNVGVYGYSGVSADSQPQRADSIVPARPDRDPRTRAHPRRLVIFIDEIDAVRNLPFSTDEFFAAIRECYNRRAQDPELHRITFCLMGVTTPSELIQDPHITPFNIGRRIELNDFTPEEAAPLALGLGDCIDTLGPVDGEGMPSDTVAQRPSPRAQALLQRVLHWTGGHPYLTQRLCQAASHATGDSGSKIQRPKSIDRLCEELFLEPGARERDDNLLFVREQLLRGGEDVAALLEMYRCVRLGRHVPDDVTNPLIGRLRLSGIVRVQAQRPIALAPLHRFIPSAPALRIGNRIYQRVFNPEWVAQHMPDAELRRQRAAYRRGLLRASAGAGVIVLVLSGLALTALQQRQEALSQREKARRRLVRLIVAAGNRLVDDGDLLASLPWFAEALRLDAGESSREAMHRLRMGTVLQQCPRPVQIWFHEGQVLHAEFSPDGRRVVTASEDQTACVWDAVNGQKVSQLMRHRGSVGWVEFSPNGRRVVTASDDHTARVWDAVTGQPVTPWLEHRETVQSAAFSPNGRWVVTASWDHTAQVWDAVTGRPVSPPLPHRDTVIGAEFDPTGQRVLTVSYDNTARVWDARTGRPAGPVISHSSYLTHAIFSPDGRQVATAGADGTARTWDIATGRAIARPMGHSREVVHIAFSPDSRRVVTASNDATARVWDSATGQALTPLMRHLRAVNHAEFSRDGRRVLTASSDGTARVWDAATGQPITPPLPHRDGLPTASFSLDGRRVVTASVDGTARVWDLSAGAPVLRTLRHRGDVEWISSHSLRGTNSVDDARFSPDARRVVTVSWDQTARVWDVDTGRPVTPTLQHFGIVTRAVFSPDSHRVGTTGNDGTVRIWDATTGRRLAPLIREQGPLGCLEFSPDGRWIVTASGQYPLSAYRQPGEARVWDVATGRPVTTALRLARAVFHASLSPDGTKVVTAGDDETARVWDAATGRLASPPLHPRGSVSYAAFSPDGGRIVTVSSRHPGQSSWITSSEVQVWDVASSRPVTPPMPQRGSASYAAFSPDGRRLVTTSRAWYPTWARPCEARVWDAVTGQPVTPPLHHDGDVLDAAFSPDGRLVATVSFDRTARVWDALTGESVTPPLRHNAWPRRVAFSPDGRRLVTACADGTAQIWELQPDLQPIAELQRLARLLAGQQIEGDAEPMPLRTDLIRSDWRTLQHSAAQHVPAAQVMAWHQREEEDAERARDWAAALPQLDRLIEAYPNAWEYPLCRGRLLARLCRWEEARAALDRAVARAPRDRELWIRCGAAWAEVGRWREAANAFARASDLGAVGLAWRWHALSRLAAGDTRGYRQLCAELTKRAGLAEDPLAAITIATACVYAPNALPNPLQPIRLARKTVERSPPYELPPFPTLGFALYRAGRFREALRQVDQDMPLIPSESLTFYWLLLAMTHHRLGHTEKARQLLSRAVEWESRHRSDLDWYKRLEVQLLCREAERMLKGSAP